jgi:hypothetical protein
LELDAGSVPDAQRRRHPDVGRPAALKNELDGDVSREAPGKSLLVLFFRKERLPFYPSLSISDLKILHSSAYASSKPGSR